MLNEHEIEVVKDLIASKLHLGAKRWELVFESDRSVILKSHGVVFVYDASGDLDSIYSVTDFPNKIAGIVE